MHPSSDRGNDPEKWEALLQTLDEKLQLGLLEHLRRVSAYHLEDDILYIDPGSEEDEEYLKRDSTFQQLQVLATDSIQIDKVKIKKLEQK